MGCTGGARPVENATGNSDLLTLDQALKEAATRIDERIQSGSKIVPLNFNSPHDRFSNYVLEELTANLVDSRILTIVDRREIDSIRNEFSFEFSGDVEEDSMQQIGRRLGAQSIITGNFTDMGGFIRIMIRVLNVENATVDVQYRANITNDTVTTALLTGGRVNTAANTPRQAASTTVTQVTNTTPIRYTVTFNANGANGTVPSSQTVQSGESITIPDNQTMSNSRGNFGGWNTRTDGTGMSYAAGDSLVVNSNIQLFARWIEQVYRIGDTGPAGGLIFYDKGNNSGGWRYLEAAPVNLGPAPFATQGYTYDNIGYFGYNSRTNERGSRALGTGKFNTEYLMRIANNKGGGFGWAVQLADSYELNGVEDWFLPSLDELNYIYGNLLMRGHGNLRSERYWSSSIGSTGWIDPSVQYINFSTGEVSSTAEQSNARYLVRPIRQF
ncbi:MAG: InlB B-repeat-containing protein [Treponema sp.]|nr:InlB B-repeat-containing protein [Treponema sp.]